jgi:tetratricopeptide (TPR) repeat protein
VKDWYAGVPLESATGKSLAVLDEEFRAALLQVDLPELALGVAKARFERPAVFGRRCPHQVDAVASKASAALGDQDPSKARELYREVLAMDPSHFGARVGLGTCALREGDVEGARNSYDEVLSGVLAGETLSALERAWLEERLGDLALGDGKSQQAGAHYDRAAKGLVDQDALRTLEVKQIAAAQSDSSAVARRAISELLIGEPAFGADWSTAAPELGRWSERDPKSGLADYLLGKNLFARGRWQQAAERLDAALQTGLATPLVRAEAIHTRLEVACALGQRQVVSQAGELYAKAPGVSQGRRLSAARLVERCLKYAAANEAPTPNGDTEVPAR